MSFRATFHWFSVANSASLRFQVAATVLWVGTAVRLSTLGMATLVFTLSGPSQVLLRLRSLQLCFTQK